MDVSFIRGDELGREQRTIPAELYNKIRLVFSRLDGDHLFVPIRTMQYLAVIDNEEIVFVDGQGPRVIEVAWRDFQPGERDNLHAPVGCTCVYYSEKGRQIMNRLLSDFLKALSLVEDRQPKPEEATVTPIERN